MHCHFSITLLIFGVDCEFTWFCRNIDHVQMCICSSWVRCFFFVFDSCLKIIICVDLERRRRMLTCVSFNVTTDESEPKRQKHAKHCANRRSDWHTLANRTIRLVSMHCSSVSGRQSSLLLSFLFANAPYVSFFSFFSFYLLYIWFIVLRSLARRSIHVVVIQQWQLSTRSSRLHCWHYHAH